MKAQGGGVSRDLWPWLLVVAVVIGADQLSKARVQETLQLPGNALPISDYFNLVLAYNRGAAFSFLSDAGGWQGGLFLVIGIAASIALLWLLARHHAQPLYAAALSLILGGALGNVIDRVRLGHVVDFLDFHWSWLGVLFPAGHFPAFNLADSAICCGAGLLILDELRRLRRRASEA